MILQKINIALLSLTLSSGLLFQACDDPAVEEGLATFNATPTINELNVSYLDEVSGIVPSFNTSGGLWLMEDSGSQPKLELINEQGVHLRTLNFNGSNRDWEDIAIGPGPDAGKKYIYLAEIGDNSVVHSSYYIYRFEEPTANQISINTYETIEFVYPNNVSYNAETLLVDPKTKDLYVITKDQLNVRVYRLAYPQNTSAINTAEFLGTIGYWALVGGDISPAGDEILLKSYSAVYYWKIKEGESIYQTLKRTHDITAPYIIEPQGEAVCWDVNASGYYTISEKAGQASNPKLYYYSKN